MDPVDIRLCSFMATLVPFPESKLFLYTSPPLILNQFPSPLLLFTLLFLLLSLLPSSSSSFPSSPSSLFFFSSLLKDTTKNKQMPRNPQHKYRMSFPEIQLKLNGNEISDSVVNLKYLPEHNTKLLFI